MYTAVQIFMEYESKACIGQTHSALVIFTLDNKKAALNFGCYRKYGCHTASKLLKQHVHVADSNPSIMVFQTVVKTINGDIVLGLMAVQFTQHFVLEINHLNILDAEGVLKAIPVVLHK